MSLSLRNGLGMGAGGGAVSNANKPAVFTVSGAVGGTIRINWNEPIVITTTGNVSIALDSTPVVSGSTVGKKLGANAYYAVVISGTAGTITFGKRNQISYLYLGSTGSAISGIITGMALIYLYLSGTGTAITYVANNFNISNSTGIQLLGDSVFSAAENRQLIIDAAAGTWSHATTRPLRIDAGTVTTDPGWDSVSAAIAILKTKTTVIIIPDAWLQANGGTWPANWGS